MRTLHECMKRATRLSNLTGKPHFYVFEGEWWTHTFGHHDKPENWEHAIRLDELTSMGRYKHE